MPGSISWLCYDLPKAQQRVWLSSDETSHGLLDTVTVRSAIIDMVALANPCSKNTSRAVSRILSRRWSRMLCAIPCFINRTVPYSFGLTQALYAA